MAHKWLYLDHSWGSPPAWNTNTCLSLAFESAWSIVPPSLQRIHSFRVFKNLSPIALWLFLLTLSYVERKNFVVPCVPLPWYCGVRGDLVVFSRWSRGDIVEPGWASWTLHQCRCHQHRPQPNMVRSFCQKYITSKVIIVVHQTLGLFCWYRVQISL